MAERAVRSCRAACRSACRSAGAPTREDGVVASWPTPASVEESESVPTVTVNVSIQPEARNWAPRQPQARWVRIMATRSLSVIGRRCARFDGGGQARYRLQWRHRNGESSSCASSRYSDGR